MKKLLSFLLIILVLGSGFISPPGRRMPMKMHAARMAMMMSHHGHKGGCCNKNKKDDCGTFCTYCILCIAFIVPVKPGIERNFVNRPVKYADLLQSKLTDYAPSCWRPPNT